MLLSKSDLLPVLGDFSPDKARRHLQQLASAAPVFEISARNGAGMEQWIHWLLAEIAALEHRMGKLDAYTRRAADSTHHDAARPLTGSPASTPWRCRPAFAS